MDSFITFWNLYLKWHKSIHRRTDWNFLWAGLHHGGPNHNAKIILKDDLRKIPGLGWIMAMTRFVFLKRSWSEDCKTLDKMLEYFSLIRWRNQSWNYKVVDHDNVTLSQGGESQTTRPLPWGNQLISVGQEEKRCLGWQKQSAGLQESSSSSDHWVCSPDQGNDGEEPPGRRLRRDHGIPGHKASVWNDPSGWKFPLSGGSCHPC